MNPTKKKPAVSPFEDGDSAHWVKSKPKKKVVTPTDKHSSVKFSGKNEPGAKKTTKKVMGNK